MYNKNEYAKLASKYGKVASWAIWDYHDKNDTTIIRKNYNKLHSNYVFLALNISALFEDLEWANFHIGPTNTRKLKYACTDNQLYGAYITDIFKGIAEPSSTKLAHMLNSTIINKNVQTFKKEMYDIKINADTKFVVLGKPNSILAECFSKYFRKDFKNDVIYQYHYAYYGISDKEWIKNLWKQLNITQDIETTVSKYK